MPKPPPSTPPGLPDGPEPGTHLDLICLEWAGKNIRGRIPPDGPKVVVRTRPPRLRPVPAEIFTVEVERSWIFGHTRYVSGTVTESHLDVPRLALRPLGLRNDGPWDPEENAWLFEMEPSPLSDEIRAAGPRTRYTRYHYQAGVAIGELSLPEPVLDFQGILPRGLIDNRPFLRCLHGLGSLTGVTATSRPPSRSSAAWSGSTPTTASAPGFSTRTCGPAWGGRRPTARPSSFPTTPYPSPAWRTARGSSRCRGTSTGNGSRATGCSAQKVRQRGPGARGCVERGAQHPR